MQVDHATPEIPAATTAGVRGLLSAMMFLEFFIWGSWFVTCGNYMAAHNMTDKIYLAYMVGPIAAIVSPFFLGIIADRFFPSERVLCVLQLIAGGSIFGAAAAGRQGNSSLFIGWLMVHTLAFMPTLSVTNTIALSKLSDARKQFPIIRVFGTFGWIAAGIVVSKVLQADTTETSFYVAGVAAIALGLFSLILPHTPPPAKGRTVDARAILGLDSLELMKSPSFAVFIIGSFLTCIPLAAYYAYAAHFVGDIGFKSPAAVMTLGQGSEVFFMLIMPLLFARLGVKYMLLAGMLAWVLRYGFFAIAAPTGIEALVIGGILLHGICYDFFFVTGFIYVDQKAPAEVRGQAQGFLVLVTQGLGMLVGAFLSGRLFNAVVTGKGSELMANWQKFWIAPCIAAAIVLMIFFVLFRDDTAKTEPAEAALAGATT